MANSVLCCRLPSHPAQPFQLFETLEEVLLTVQRKYRQIFHQACLGLQSWTKILTHLRKTNAFYLSSCVTEKHIFFVDSRHIFFVDSRHIFFVDSRGECLNYFCPLLQQRLAESFFACLRTETQPRRINIQNRNEVNIQIHVS